MMTLHLYHVPDVHASAVHAHSHLFPSQLINRLMESPAHKAKITKMTVLAQFIYELLAPSVPSAQKNHQLSKVLANVVKMIQPAPGIQKCQGRSDSAKVGFLFT